MRGVIVIEGADASGKTTLAKYLVERFDGEYVHMTYYKDCWTAHLNCIHKVIKLAEKKLVIVDRHWISESIYAKIFRQGSQYPLSARFMDRMFIKMGAIYIMCIPSNEKEQIKRHASRKEDEMYDNINRVIVAYNDFFHGNDRLNIFTTDDYCLSFMRTGGFKKRDDVILYDMDNQKPGDLSYIADIVDNRYDTNSHWRSHFSANIIGNVVDPKVVFIGEAVSSKHPNNLPPWPWGGKCDTKSASRTLYQAFQDLNVDETKVAFTNTFCPGFGPELMTLLYAFKDATFIAMGKKAQNYCVHAQKINIHHVSHPQWIRRFDYNTPYAEYIKDLIPDTVKRS